MSDPILSGTAESEYPEASRSRLFYYPAPGSSLISLALPGRYPVSTSYVAWSLPDTPGGITIDSDGSITVTAGAALEADNDITVQAVYRGVSYTGMLSITKMRLAADGVPGLPGKDGVTYHTWIRYADDAQGGGISNNPAGKEYIGFAYNKTTPVESPKPEDYQWALIKGEDGVDGEGGYTRIKYSDYADGTGLYQQPTGDTKYIGIAVNKTTPKESDDKADYIWSLFRGNDGISPIWVDLGRETVMVPCDYRGAPAFTALPVQTRARIFKGTTEISAATEVNAVRAKRVIRYPATGSAVMSPMLPGRYPVVTYPVAWSLSGAPAGVSIDVAGLISITAAAALGDNNVITVNALYGGQTYTAALTVTKAREGAPGRAGENSPQGERATTYLGTTATIPTGNVVVIVKGEKTGQVSAVPGDFALMTATGLAWTRGMLRQWSGTVWVELVIESHVAEYMQAGLDLMEMSDLGGQTNSFPAIFTRLLFAMFIKVGAAITGGDRYNPDGTVKDANKKGFWLGADGTLKAEKAEISGTVNATDGVFKGRVEADGGSFKDAEIRNVTITGDSLFQGGIISGPLVLLNQSPTGNTFNYPSGTRSNVIVNEAVSYLGFSLKDKVEVTYSIIGTYNGIGIIRIGYYYENNYHGASYDRTVYIYYKDGTRSRIAYRNSDGDYLDTQYALVFNYAYSGKTFKLVDISDKAGESGLVYKDNNGYLRIS